MLETSRLCRALLGCSWRGARCPRRRSWSRPQRRRNRSTIAPARATIRGLRKKQKRCSRRRKQMCNARAPSARSGSRHGRISLPRARRSRRKDHGTAIRHAKRASELAQLGLEQLAYPGGEMIQRRIVMKRLLIIASPAWPRRSPGAALQVRRQGRQDRLFRPAAGQPRLQAAEHPVRRRGPRRRAQERRRARQGSAEGPRRGARQGEEGR